MNKFTTDLKVGECLIIGDATVRLEKKSGQVARLVVTASADTQVINPQDRRNTANTARKSALPATSQESTHAHNPPPHS